MSGTRFDALFFVSFGGPEQHDDVIPFLEFKGAYAELKGVMTKVEGSAMVQVKAPVAQINGDGVLMAKGGITMIN